MHGRYCRNARVRNNVVTRCVVGRWFASTLHFPGLPCNKLRMSKEKKHVVNKIKPTISVQRRRKVWKIVVIQLRSVEFVYSINYEYSENKCVQFFSGIKYSMRLNRFLHSDNLCNAVSHWNTIMRGDRYEFQK